MKTISRRNAKKNNNKHYFTGNPCKHGHVDVRYTSNGKCVSCCKVEFKTAYTTNKAEILQRNKEYRDNNPDKIREQNRRWVTRNPEKIKNIQKKWRSNNTIKIKEWGDTWRENNPEYHRIYTKENYNARYHQEWREANHSKWLASSARYRATKLNATTRWANLHKIEEIYETARLLSTQNNINYQVDHIVPLQSNTVCGLHCEDNLRILTAEENRRKSNNFEI